MPAIAPGSNIRRRGRRSRSLLAALGTALLVVGAARADVIVDWNAIAATSIAVNAARPIPAFAIDLAYVNAAMYDAVNGIVGGYTPYAVNLAAPTGANPSAAAASAAHDVLLSFFPPQQQYLDAALAMTLATLPAGGDRDHGVAYGKDVAAQLLASRAGDGRNAAIGFTPGTGPGQWQPPPPAFGPAATPWIAKFRPFALQSPSQFRAEPPPDLSSPDWAADYNEVKAFGAADSALRTPAQTELALFYTDHPGLQNNRVLRDLAIVRGMSLADNARLFATATMSAADAIVACWDSKYAYTFWRPVTAIRAGGTDGNNRTAGDPNWTPLAPTPSHPEYPSAHSCVSSATAEALRWFFGTKEVPLTISSTITHTTHLIPRTDKLVDEVVGARIYAGFHYRTSCIHGAVIGKQVAQWVAKNYFQPKH